MTHKPTHPHAVVAVFLARLLYGAPAHVVARAVNEAGIPHRLFVLASHLQTAPRIGSIVDTTA